jgi:hypothetical protein
MTTMTLKNKKETVGFKTFFVFFSSFFNQGQVGVFKSLAFYFILFLAVSDFYPISRRVFCFQAVFGFLLFFFRFFLFS